MTKVTFACDRCGKEVTGLHTPHGTAGFYVVSPGKAWERYAQTKNEHFVCDSCVQSMPEYKAIYGAPV